MRKFFITTIYLLVSWSAFSQGLNSQWLIGNSTGFIMGRFEFTDTSYAFIQAQRKMTFRGTQANISDNNGNLLMSSNGVWIANATGDTMLNGNGLNPGYYVNTWPNGLLIPHGNMALPFPGDSNKIVLFHQTRLSESSYLGGIYFSIIDLSFDNGMGMVVSKNNVLIQDQLTWGLAACRHANGRDWWVVAQKDSSDVLFLMLLTPNGISNPVLHSLNYTPFAAGNVAQISFSNDGTKFLQVNYDNPISKNSNLILADFDRCTGLFSNTQSVQIASNNYIAGAVFSPEGDYAYACTATEVFQINANTLSIDTVAIYDGFCFPNNPWCTTFFNMYLAANGKIYITSGSGVQHIHEMNYPDSAGIACDVQQHAINLNGTWSFRSVPNHPNYYLGAVTGSVCDSLSIGIQELQAHDFRFSVSPNPSHGNFRMIYLLPQNQSGVLEVYDVNGRRVFAMNLPPWSTLQEVILPLDLTGGVYSCVVSSGGQRAGRKLVVIKN